MKLGKGWNVRAGDEEDAINAREKFGPLHNVHRKNVGPNDVIPTHTHGTHAL
jgi:hypothetical protein